MGKLRSASNTTTNLEKERVLCHPVVNPAWEERGKITRKRVRAGDRRGGLCSHVGRLSPRNGQKKEVLGEGGSKAPFPLRRGRREKKKPAPSFQVSGAGGKGFARRSF